MELALIIIIIIRNKINKYRNEKYRKHLINKYCRSKSEDFDIYI